MKVNVETIAAIQFLIMGYAIFAVRHKNDRRRTPPDMLHALYAVAGFSTVVLIASVGLDLLADGRRLSSIRNIFEIGCFSAAGAVIAALRILKGAPYERNREQR
jgi:hypothetical protein